jgi:hypothetical protein
VTCERRGCTSPATCAVGIAIFPVKAVMEYHKTNEPLTRLLFTLTLCDPHLHEAIEAGAGALMARDKLEAICKFAGKSARVAVDVDASKVVRVELNDPDLLVLQKHSLEKTREEARP